MFDCCNCDVSGELRTNFHNIYFLEKKNCYLSELCHCHKDYIPHSMILKIKEWKLIQRFKTHTHPQTEIKPFNLN
jgi:hypothetical protein